MMNKALHPRNDIDPKYKKKQEEGDVPVLRVAWTQQFKGIHKKNKERLITTTRKSNINIRTTKSRKQK